VRPTLEDIVVVDVDDCSGWREMSYLVCWWKSKVGLRRGVHSAFFACESEGGTD
jgi:hypothetical protein